jgi:DNA (cytosine-5)-methyltransferase 1
MLPGFPDRYIRYTPSKRREWTGSGSIHKPRDMEAGGLDVLDSRPTVVDLYAGAGLFSLAFNQCGFRIIRAIELDPVAAATYAANLGDHVEEADVTKTAPDVKSDVLIAGPPCQGFSTLGCRRHDDPRNRLSLEVVRWAEKMRPQAVVIENVASFLDSPVWNRVTQRLGRLEYRVDSFVLDAFDYGCPQVRRRSFTIAHLNSEEIALPRRRRSLQTVNEAWSGLPRRPNGKNCHWSPTPSEIALARMRVIPPGGDKRDVMRRARHLAPASWWRVSSEVTDAWGRMEWDKPCNTLRTALQNASKGRYIHPDQDRVISLREAARLHTIPDEWQFVGLPTQVARQIGNSVPPSLGRSVARLVLRIIGG